MRLFVGIAVPDDVRARLQAYGASRRRLASASAAVRWTHPADLHVTTKFVGAFPPARRHDLEAALEALRLRSPFRVALDGIGWFGRDENPRVLWAAVQGGSALADLAAATDEATSAFGVAKETRAYVPHVTLASIARRGQGSSPRAVASMPETPFGAFEAHGFSLFESMSGESVGGDEPRYRRLVDYEFRGPRSSV